MTCNNQYINPLGLEGDAEVDDEQEQGGDPTVSMGIGRRKKRSTVKRMLRNKRQEVPTEQGLSENVTVSGKESEGSTSENKVTSFSFSLELYIIRIQYCSQLRQCQMQRLWTLWLQQYTSGY